MAKIRIFISYRREDATKEVAEIFDDFWRHFGGDMVLLDVRSIEPGQNFVAWIKQRVKQSDAVLVVIGKKWLNARDQEGNLRLSNPNDFVLLEISDGLRLGKKIIPVLVQGAMMPQAAELPEAIRPLTDLNAAVLPDIESATERGTEMRKLISVLEKKFPFYKDINWLILTPLWLIATFAAAYFSDILLRKILAYYNLSLPVVPNSTLALSLAALAWTIIYAYEGASDYSLGRRGMLLLPVEPFSDLFEGIEDFISTIFIAFPLNFLLSWSLSHGLATLGQKYLGGNYSNWLLIVFGLLTAYLINSFTGGHGTFYSIRNHRYDHLYKPPEQKRFSPRFSSTNNPFRDFKGDPKIEKD